MTDWTDFIAPEALNAWMEARGQGEIENGSLLGGGTQNILLRFERNGRAFVLRRSPPHPRTNSNATMRREM
jgi:aminoglycoside phosphotransferase (APT) family kinase protein